MAQTLDVVRRTVDQHNKTLLDLAGAPSLGKALTRRSSPSKITSLSSGCAWIERLGASVDRVINIRDPGGLPSRLDPPSTEALLADIQDRRLDLLALRRGYESEDAKLRAAILEQFPKINLGFNAAQYKQRSLGGV